MAVYMKVVGIEGGVTQSSHPKWIQINSCEMPVVRPGVNTTPGKVVDRLRSAVDFEDITLRKDGDISSGHLMKWMINGETKEVIIHFCKEKGDTILEVKLHNTLLTNYRYSMRADDPLEEELKLDFTKIEMVYTSYDAKNTKMKPFPVGYDLATAAAM
jgi:type VI secretion system secreted protein Hcp